ncbi:MAG: carboxynorspermidine decarboxylase [Brevinematia bacterium]
MERDNFLKFIKEKVETPAFIIDEAGLRQNLSILKKVIERTGCKILLALKAFSNYAFAGIITETLHGVCASSVNEARLGREKFGKEVHVYAPAYSEADFLELLKYADHIDFNSFSLWERLKPLTRNLKREVKFGIRVNPEHSEGTVEIYDPCAPYSRLGVIKSEFRKDKLDGISYLHFHTLCEQNARPLARTVEAFENKFKEYIHKMEYINFGGGHHITKEGYDIDLLCDVINRFKDRWGVEVYLEPGEAVALNAGYLVSRVLDIMRNGMEIAILDTSAATHMPDVLEMPYRPHVIGSGKAFEKKYTYRFGGISCLAGDVIGDFSFDYPLKAGDRVIFTDMAIYTMVKTNTFNGINLPSIYIANTEKGSLKLWKRFGYKDFLSRL